MIKTFGVSAFITIAAIIIAFYSGGINAAYVTTVLIAIEIAFSFDNAVINAKILDRLSRFWQQMFLTVGLLFAIVFMRLVFPIVIVMITANLPWSTVVNDALHDPQKYSEYLNEAHTTIAAFGGAFLMTLTAYFFLDRQREITWLHYIERPMQKIGSTTWLPPLVVSILVVVISLFAGSHSKEVLEAGLFGVVLYTGIKLMVDGLGKLAPKEQKIYTGWPAFLAFMYLQILDASFSFDGVIGAFAITEKVLLIALGLGVGAIWVRSFTVFMVRHGTLKNYLYLEHGAHYAIMVLAAAMLGSIFIEIPDLITGAVGIGIIAASLLASIEAKKARA